MLPASAGRLPAFIGPGIGLSAGQIPACRWSDGRELPGDPLEQLRVAGGQHAEHVGGNLRPRRGPVPAGRRRPVAQVLLVEGVLRAGAAVDPALGRAFLRVVNMIDPPVSLLSPATAFRVLRAGGGRQVRKRDA